MRLQIIWVFFTSNAHKHICRRKQRAIVIIWYLQFVAGEPSSVVQITGVEKDISPLGKARVLVSALSSVLSAWPFICQGNWRSHRTFRSHHGNSESPKSILINKCFGCLTCALQVLPYSSSHPPAPSSTGCF